MICSYDFFFSKNITNGIRHSRNKGKYIEEIRETLMLWKINEGCRMSTTVLLMTKILREWKCLALNFILICRMSRHSSDVRRKREWKKALICTHALWSSTTIFMRNPEKAWNPHDIIKLEMEIQKFK